MIDNLNSPYIHAADSENFKALVIDNSYQGPVLVNFWSRKAGPCLRQYPVLDKLVHQYAGCLLLVNVDTETEFVYTREYAVTSVPLLKLFRQGQVMETWRGYQSEADLRKVLDLYVARDSDRILAEAIHHYADGRGTEAYDMLAKAILDDPGNPRLPLAVCKLLKHEQRYAEALHLIESLPEELRRLREIVQLKEHLAFSAELGPDLDSAELQARLESEPNDLGLQQQWVTHLVVQQQYETALEQLLAMMDIDKTHNDNYPQRTMLSLFRLLGDDHPLTTRYRNRLMRYSH